MIFVCPCQHLCHIEPAPPPPPPSQFKSKCSFPISTMFIQAQSLISHLHSLKLSLNAHIPPPLCPFKLECSSPTSTMSIQAQTLTSYLDCVYSSSVTHLLPQPSQFECEHEDQCSLPSPTVFIRAQTQVRPPWHVNLSMTTLTHLDHVTMIPISATQPWHQRTQDWSHAQF